MRRACATRWLRLDGGWLAGSLLPAGVARAAFACAVSQDPWLLACQYAPTTGSGQLATGDCLGRRTTPGSESG